MYPSRGAIEAVGADEIGVVQAQQADRPRHLLEVERQVGVGVQHEIALGRRQSSLDRAAQLAVHGMVDDADVGVLVSQDIGELRGAVSRLVVDDDQLVITDHPVVDHLRADRCRRSDRPFDVILLVPHREEDRQQLGGRSHVGRWVHIVSVASDEAPAPPEWPNALTKRPASACVAGERSETLPALPTLDPVEPVTSPAAPVAPPPLPPPAPPPPSGPSASDVRRTPVGPVAGQLTNGWRFVTGFAWALVIVAYAAVFGVSESLAEAIVTHRDKTGPFRNRKALLKVSRLGPKAFEQCAGFLRIRGGDDPIDGLGVHPEAYPVVRRILDRSGITLAELIGNERSLRSLRPADFADDRFGIPTVTDILAELEKPGRDPRPAFSTATFAAGVEKVADLKVGMVLEGVVTNVAAFGAFVDVGVHQDGLVHVSAMADRFVSDPHEVVRSGQVVRVKVLDVDVERQRIGLSLRLNDTPQQDRGKRSDRAGSSRRDAGNKGRGERNPSRGRDSGRQAPNQAAGSMAQALRDAGLGQPRS